MNESEIAARNATQTTAFTVLGALSFSHFLNDMLQSLIPAMYPLLRTTYSLDFGQIGIITFVYQCTASLLQPIVGIYTDKHPQPFSLAAGMGVTGVGILVLAFAGHFYAVLVGAGLVGVGSSVFHPESSRIARAASGGRHGLAQSVFQLGGNAGQAFGPLLAAWVVVGRAQSTLAWAILFALLGVTVLTMVGQWYHNHRLTTARSAQPITSAYTPREVKLAVIVLLLLIFSKYFYLVSLTSYYTLYLIDRFHVSVTSAQVYLFVFLGAVALGTLIGGHVGDRIGRKPVIWYSILGVLPFTLVLPYSNLLWTVVLSVPIGLILASAFPAIIVYAQELMPGKVGTISGLFFGFAFGMGGLGAALLGQLADKTSINFVYHVCAYLPALGLLAALLPSMQREKKVVS
jgi:MFS transporter, FSR family, fosmidomycin resistance protein